MTHQRWPHDQRPSNHAVLRRKPRPPHDEPSSGHASERGASKDSDLDAGAPRRQSSDGRTPGVSRAPSAPADSRAAATAPRR
eukprot:8046855-Heterocapsa_arctica.AAC.1